MQSTPNKIFYLATVLMQISLVLAALLTWFHRDYLVLAMSVITFIVMLAPYYFKRRHNITLPLTFEFSVILFIYAAIFLGELVFYRAFWWWDIALHTISGLGIGLIGFTIIYYIYRLRRFIASPFLIAFLTFCFALAFGALWEIFEFAMDQNFGTNMQKNGLTDTMWDLIVDAVGALVASVAAYYYVKNRGRGVPVFKSLMKEFLDKNPQFK